MSEDNTAAQDFQRARRRQEVLRNKARWEPYRRTNNLNNTLAPHETALIEAARIFENQQPIYTQPNARPYIHSDYFPVLQSARPLSGHYWSAALRRERAILDLDSLKDIENLRQNPLPLPLDANPFASRPRLVPETIYETHLGHNWSHHSNIKTKDAVLSHLLSRSQIYSYLATDEAHQKFFNKHARVSLDIEGGST